jgi:hypothetical protein
MPTMAGWAIYPVVAFLLLGIERCLYGYVFHFPQDFIRRCQSGQLGATFQKDKEYWRSFMTLGIYIKVFQFSVIYYDLSVKNTMQYNATWVAAAGAVLVVIGQILNAAAYQALGGIGIYYGYELGFHVPRITTFPYNMGFSDPQYWGVLASIFGLYIMVQAQSFLIPYLELFWYVLSMKVLEHSTATTKATTTTATKRTPSVAR